MTTTTVTGTNGTADDFYIYPQTWSGGTITGYEDYDIVDFELGADILYVPFNGDFASFSTIADFQQAIYDIEATGNLGWSAIGTSYEVVGDDIVFSWDGQGQITLTGLASSFETAPEVVTIETAGDNGTSQLDDITIDRDGWEGMSFDTGYGDDIVTIGSSDGGGWVSVSNSGGSDTIDLSGLGIYESAFVWGADDSNESETVTTGAADDTVFTYAGDDTVTTGDGNDQVVVHDGDQFVFLGSGTDTFVSQGSGTKTVTGGSQRDYFEIGKTGVDSDAVLVITDLTLQDGNIGGSGEDILDLYVSGQHLEINNRNDLAGLDARADTTVENVGGDLVITNDWFGTVIAEDVGFYF